jgi:hypothetical protein
MSVITHYYQSNGIAAQITDFCFAPIDYASECLEVAQEAQLELDMSERITNYALAFFIGLASLPLYLTGLVVHLMCREEIPLARYEEEKNKWTNRFYTHTTTDGRVLLNEDSQTLIDLLIKSRKSADDCPYQHILCRGFSLGSSVNILGIDGRYTDFREHLKEQESAEKTLIIGCSTKNSFIQEIQTVIVGDQRFDTAQISSDDLYPEDPLSSNFKKFLVRQINGFEHDFSNKMRTLWMEPLGSKLSDRVLSVLFSSSQQ